MIGEIATTLTINDEQRRLGIEPWTTLLDLLRDKLDLTARAMPAAELVAVLANRCRLPVR